MLTLEQVKAIADLAKINLRPEDLSILQKQLSDTIDYINKLDELDQAIIRSTETHQVGGLKNVFREDVIDLTRVLSQEETLKNSQKSHRGFFVVPKIFDL